MAWLLRDNEVLCSVERATTRKERRIGLLGRDGVAGALVLEPARSVHTFKMRFAIDVAHVAKDGTVLRVTTMKPGRLGALVWRSDSVIEAEAGAFERWRLRVGDIVTVRTSM